MLNELSPGASGGSGSGSAGGSGSGSAGGSGSGSAGERGEGVGGVVGGGGGGRAEGRFSLVFEAIVPIAPTAPTPAAIVEGDGEFSLSRLSRV